MSFSEGEKQKHKANRHIISDESRIDNHIFSHHLCYQLFLAALNALAHAALLRSVFITRFAITDGGLALVGGGGILVADSTLRHA